MRVAGADRADSADRADVVYTETPRSVHLEPAPDLANRRIDA